MDVEIDGGVKVENAQRAVDAGATVLVSASGIYKAGPGAARTRPRRDRLAGTIHVSAREGTA